MGADAPWRESIGEDAWYSAFKEECNHPLREVPGLEHAGRIHPDTMHMFHLGWGQDLAASAICLLARFKLFSRVTKFEVRLDAAYDLFMSYCSEHGKTTGCDSFSKLAFDMQTTLSLLRSSIPIALSTV